MRVISTFGIYSSHGSRENVRTDLPTNRQTDKPTDYNNPSLRMRARGLITTRMLSIMGERELRLHSTALNNYILHCTVNDLY